MERSIAPHIRKDLKQKIILLSGPRQVGKTTVAQSLCTDYSYLNFDFAEHRTVILKRQWPKDVKLLILDELHKMPGWKRWLKGIYDVEGLHPSIIVTGSARLDVARKMGDSLAGRHFNYHLNPFTLKEVGAKFPDAFQRLLRVGGFPEPFLNGDITFYKKWQTSHLDVILRQDLLDLEQVRRISQLETLVELLRHKVGSPCSYSSLAEDLQADHNTVKRWLTILENLFVIFRVTPYHRNIARAIQKTPKFYFYDLARVPENNGARFENLVALSLRSEIDLLTNLEGRKLTLNFLRDKEGNEIDFLITEEGHNLLALEAKWSETDPEKSFKKFFGTHKLKVNRYVQLVAETKTRREHDSGLKIEPAEAWLRKLELPS